MPGTAAQTIATRASLDSIGINLILGGFPKCATTSLASWINDSSHVTVSNPKETYCLCPEIQPERDGSPWSLRECFPLHRSKWMVEASTLNVYSRSLRDAVAADDETKVILSVRDPAEAVISWHNQMIQAGIATSIDFETCWEESLRLDQRWDSRADDPITFRRNYLRMFSFGYWVQHWIDAIGHQRVLILRTEQMRSDPSGVRAQLDRFLGPLALSELPPRLNQFASIRCESFYKQLRESRLNLAFRQFEMRFPAMGTIRRAVKEQVFRKPQKKTISSETGIQLGTHFVKDQVLMDSLWAENQRHWSSVVAD
ncbi:sulfotransferase domain-containing protein [Roseiconus nitratireducens]|nr:sulfotransferase domain-containing protein [Roseiconus nitratireducens]